MSSLTVVWNRVFAVVGRVSMYRLVVLALAALAAIAKANLPRNPTPTSKTKQP